MKHRTKIAVMAMTSWLVLAAVAAAQNAAKPAEAAKPLIPLKVEVVINEYAGAKRVISLPYALLLYTNPPRHRSGTSLRMGLNVPILAGTAPLRYNYQHAGTSIDCNVDSLDDGKFGVHAAVNWSSIYSPPSASRGKGAVPSSPGSPVFSSFSTDLYLIMHDGQTTQSTMATDPVSGHVIKVDVTLHVVKNQ
ncbi:MAG: hypothetical protein ACRD11_09860 [Terriglobia bacterium]